MLSISYCKYDLKFAAEHCSTFDYIEEKSQHRLQILLQLFIEPLKTVFIFVKWHVWI